MENNFKPGDIIKLKGREWIYLYLKKIGRGATLLRLCKVNDDEICSVNYESVMWAKHFDIIKGKR